MTAAFFLGQDVNLASELGVRMDGTGLAQNLTTLNVLLVNATQQSTDVVAGFCVVQQLVEHFDIGDDGGLLLFHQANDLDRLVLLDDAALDTTGSDGAAAGDGEDVLDRHQEGHVSLAVRGRDIVVNSVHELLDGGIGGVVGVVALASQSLQGRAADDRHFVAGELVSAQQLTNFHLNQLQQLGIVHLVGLVQEHDDSGHAHLTGQQDVLTSLSHGAVGSSDNQDGAVHLSSAGDHVLDIVGVARAVDVSVVTLVGLVLNVSGVDGDAALALLGSLIDAGVVLVLSLALQGQVLGDRSGGSGLAVVNVADGADVDMGLCSLKFSLSHLNSPP